jgi:diguanylate cyclase (GGDEF)-like protein
MGRSTSDDGATGASDASVPSADGADARWARSAPYTRAGLDGLFAAFLERSARQPRWALMVETAALIGLVALLDYLTGTEIAFSVFYLLPIVFVAWMISARVGLVAAGVSAALWGLLDAVFGSGYSSPVVPVWNAAVRLTFFTIVVVLVGAVRRAASRESEMARTDSLTGAANGRSFADRARLALASMRRSGRPLTFAYADLDEFKRVNDTAGHSEGDELLRIVATAIASRLRETDVVARLGGDEFGILLPDTDAEAAANVLGSLAHTVNEAVGDLWPVGFTIGAVTFSEPPKGVDEMVSAADSLMYQGKRAGRGQILHRVWPRDDRVPPAGE